MALEIGIGADNSQLKSKLAESQLLLENLKKQKASDIKIGLDVTNLQKQINDTKANINSLSTQIKSNASAMDNHSRATANGSNTLTQFSRIAQDAPFGIIGIGNNLTATAESFAHLSQSAGGAGGALKAVASSLMGTGGILLAVSLVTTGLTLMAQKGLTISDVFQMLSGSFDQAGRDIKKAYEESSKSALGEVASIKAVIAVAQDEKISRKERLQAVNDLQSKYPAYFGNLSKEQILYGDLSKEIKNVSEALINKALAEKISEKAGDAAFKQLQLNAQLIKGKETLKRAEENLQNAVTNGASSQALATYSNELNRAKTNLQEIRNEVLKNNKVLDRFESILKKTSQSEIAGNAAESDVTDAAAAAKARLAEEKRAAAERAKEAERQRKKDLEEQEKYNQSVLDGQNRLAAATALAKSDQYNYEKEQRQLALDKAAKDIQDHEDFIANVGKTQDAKKAEQDQASYSARLAQLNQFLAQKLITQEEYDALVYEAAKNTNATLKQFDNDAYNLITGSISDTFGQLGTAIGNALATGGNVLNSMGKSLLQGLGKFISEMGSMLIQYGTMTMIKGKLDLAIKKGGKFAIAAGIGAIAVGVAAKAVGAAISAKANSGIGGGDDVAMGQRGSVSSGADLSSPTSSVSSGGTFNNSGGTVVFEIAGQKLIGVLNNTTQGNLRLGGSGLVG
jgi:hypothetical protein